MLLFSFTTCSGSHGFLPLAKHKISSPLLFAILITFPIFPWYQSFQFPKQAVLFVFSHDVPYAWSQSLFPTLPSKFFIILRVQSDCHLLLEAFSDSPRKRSHSSPMHPQIFMHLYLFPVAALSNCPKLVGLKQENILSHGSRGQSLKSRCQQGFVLLKDSGDH